MFYRLSRTISEALKGLLKVKGCSRKTFRLRGLECSSVTLLREHFRRTLLSGQCRLAGMSVSHENGAVMAAQVGRGNTAGRTVNACLFLPLEQCSWGEGKDNDTGTPSQLSFVLEEATSVY